MRVLLTGADGFLGWHTRVRLRALAPHEVTSVTRHNWRDLPSLIHGVDAVIHVAGINKGTPHEVENGNLRLAEDLAGALKAAPNVQHVVFANSTWAGTQTPYGLGKANADAALCRACAEIGAEYVDVRLPNLFGEGCRPNYNSFVATFVHNIILGYKPRIADRPIQLLHVQAAADSLISALSTPATTIEPQGTETTVQQTYDTLMVMKALYDLGDIPPLRDQLSLDLFNSLRWGLFPHHYPIMLPTHRDSRGNLVEAVRAHGGQGQTFVSTTRPGITRGQHYHLGKVERFVVIRGQARISLRKVLTDNVVHFDVDGDKPAVVDMPTLWAHNITNIGRDDLITVFWTQELFDPETPDTFSEPVSMERCA